MKEVFQTSSKESFDSFKKTLGNTTKSKNFNDFLGSLQKMKPNHETMNMVCGGCDHAFSTHNIFVNTETSKLTAKCKVCDCNNISVG